MSERDETNKQFLIERIAAHLVRLDALGEDDPLLRTAIETSIENCQKLLERVQNFAAQQEG